MQTIQFNDLVQRFVKVPAKGLKWLTPIQEIKTLIAEDSQQPQNLGDTFCDPNDFYIQVKKKVERKTKQYNANKDFNIGKKAEEKKEVKQVRDAEQDIASPSDQKKKVYRPGPFALFYELSENKLDKDEKVWYYKAQKQIIGPTSSYNMDKMVYYKNFQDQTKVAFKSVEKFVKFSKIKKIVESNKKQPTLEPTVEPISNEQPQ